MAVSGNDEHASMLRIEKFSGENFHLWKFKMQMVLEDKDLWGIVKGIEVEPTDEGTTETQRRQFQRRERKAFATICLSLGDEQLSLVRSATTAKDALSKLEGHYEVKSLANKLFLRKNMGVDESMSEHINKMKELAGQLEAVGALITEEDQVATLLCSLPDSYDSLITALESRADDLSLEFVTARLLHEEHKRKETIPTSDCGEKALLSTKYDQVNPRNPKPKRKGKCHNCGIPGHWARECRKPKRGRSGEVKGKKDGSSYSATTEHASFWSSKHVNCTDSTWYIDSGASQHMSYDKEMMVDYVHFVNPQRVRLGDKRVVEALGKGTVWLKIKAENDYKPARLVDVLYVPDLAKNLFSVSVVAKRGYSVELQQSGCVILDKCGTIWGSGKMQNNLYVLDISEKKVDCHDVNAATNEHLEDLWHQRYGHLSMKNLRLLRDQKLVTGLDFQSTKESDFCEGCA
ncbi:gag-pol poly [Paramuricea clavata]|uniref:Gag-pol poly n=1 Tax=Paramuricea clavata TaxID=317549 RepID=A0A6S7GNP2_PARCT|nr:gag-pol poly [Paramuricea clavata]